MLSIFSKSRQPEKLFFETDIHCHILPGIDDGSPDVATSVSLVSKMKDMGLRRIIASPHVTYGTFENTPETVGAAKAELQAALDAAGIEVDLQNSAEYRIDDLLMSHIEQDILMPLPGKHLLVENSFIQEPWNLDRFLFELQLKGYVPILAHPERYAYYYGKKERYKQMHEAGINFQINVLSLSGCYGKDEKRIAEWLIEKGYVDFIGTDLHRQSHVDSIMTYLKSKDYKRHREALETLVKNDEI
ncbi:MAG: tyrosine-protein phosphatase [Muribaculaceae bacterium]